MFSKEIEVASDDSDENDSKRRLFARATPVFNADQVDGFTDRPPVTAVASVADIDAVVSATGATIVHGGARACFIPQLDEIHLPQRGAFVG